MEKKQGCDVDQKSQVIRRQDLTDLGDTFKKSLAPVLSLVGLTKEQNLLVKDSNHCVKDTNYKQKWHSICLIILTAGFIAVAVAQTRTSNDQDETIKLQKEMVAGGTQVQKDLAEVTKELRELMQHARKTREDVADIKEDQDEEPAVQLVAETDPIKARKAPMKVRILPPKRKYSARKDVAPASSAVELPIGRTHVK